MIKSFSKLFLIVISSALLSSNVYASVFFETDMVCPVGGETFKHSHWGGCTTFGRDMTFKSRATCGDYHIIPRCPNGLPMYKDFSEDEIDILEVVLKEHNQEISELPDWLASYVISKHLPEQDAEASFWNLMFGFRYNTDEFISDKKWLSLLRQEFELFRSNIPFEEATYSEAVMAYAALLMDDRETFDEIFQKLKNRPLNDPYLKQYIARVRQCSKHWDEEQCSPRTEWYVE
jgi:hypothetical protein